MALKKIIDAIKRFCECKDTKCDKCEKDPCSCKNTCDCEKTERKPESCEKCKE